MVSDDVMAGVDVCRIYTTGSMTVPIPDDMLGGSDEY